MRTLFIGSHCDDIELACGGTVSKIRDDKFFLIFSVCNKPILHSEFRSTFEYLGIKEENTRVLNFNFREFYWQQGQILNILIDMREAWRPHRVYTHSINCTHQDHQIVAQESIRAFKECELITYTHPWNGIGNDNFFSEISDDDLANKINSIRQYQSQMHRPYTTHDYISSAAIYNGVRAGVKYAEAFEILRRLE